MIHARQALCAFARQFFEYEMPGGYVWRDVELHEAEPSAPEPSGRRNRLGKVKEIVVLEFDDFRLRLSSTEEKPPLGLVELFVDGEPSAEGPLDVSTLARVRDAIEERCHASS